MSFQINHDRVSISILLLLNIVAPLISSTNASSSDKYSQPLYGDGDDADFAPMSPATHDIRQTNTRPDAPDEFDDGQQRNFRIRLRDLQGFIGQLVDDEQMKMENDAIATVGMSNRRALNTNLLFNDQVIERVKQFAERYIFQHGTTNALQASGRVFLFKGLHHCTFAA